MQKRERLAAVGCSEGGEEPSPLAKATFVLSFLMS